MSTHAPLSAAYRPSRSQSGTGAGRIGNWPDPMRGRIGNWPDPMRGRSGNWPDPMSGLIGNWPDPMQPQR